MFGISFFSNKVASHMFNAGFPLSDMPPNNVFKPLCDELKAHGYTAETAAELWIKCLRDNDTSAIQELCNNTESLGKMIFNIRS